MPGDTEVMVTTSALLRRALLVEQSWE